MPEMGGWTPAKDELCHICVTTCGELQQDPAGHAWHPPVFMTSTETAAAAAPLARRRSVAALIAGAFIVAMPVSAASPAQAVEASGVSNSVATVSVAAAPYRSGLTLGDRKLRKGKRGSDVKQLQKLLDQKRTGHFNRWNHKKVKGIERRAGMRVDGVVGRRAIKAIKAEARARTTSSRSSSRGCTNGSSVSGVNARAAAVHRAVCAKFPSIRNYGGYRPGGGNHTAGRAVDIMVSGSLGWRVAKYVRANAGRLGATEVIYSRNIWTTQRSSEGWRWMSDRGSVTANHYDHVHVTTR